MNVLEKQMIIDRSVRIAAEASYLCHGVSLKAASGLNIQMYHSQGIDQLRFTFIDERLPDHYIKYSMPDLPEPAMDEIGHTPVVSIKHEFIDLRDRKYKAFNANYPYYKSTDPYFSPILMKLTNLRPDFDEVEKIIKEAIKAFRDLYDENTEHVPEKSCM